MVSAILYNTSKFQAQKISQLEKCERKYIFNVNFWI